SAVHPSPRRPRLLEPAARRRDPGRPTTRRAHGSASERTRSAARLDRAAQIPRKLNCAPVQTHQAVTWARPARRWDASNPRGGTASMPFREKWLIERVLMQPVPSLVPLPVQTGAKARGFSPIALELTAETDSLLEGRVTSELVSELKFRSSQKIRFSEVLG